MNERDAAILAMPRVTQALELIGQVTIMSNSIDEGWYLIYTGLVHQTPRVQADQIFRQFNTGSSQRQLIRSLVDATFPDDSEFGKEFKRLLRATDELSGERNHVIHGSYWFDNMNGLPGLRVAPGGDMNKKRNKYAEFGTGLVDELEKLVAKLEKLDEEVEEFRLIVAQEFIPGEILPFQAAVDSMPADVAKRLPRQFRERVAPARLRLKP